MSTFTFPTIDEVKSRGTVGFASRMLTVMAVYPAMLVVPGPVFLSPFALSLYLHWDWPWVVACAGVAFLLLVKICVDSARCLAVTRSLTGKYSVDHLLLMLGAVVWLGVAAVLTACWLAGI